MPAFNESRSISETIIKIKSAMKKNKLKVKKILVIDDGSTDETVARISKLRDVDIFSHKVNRGLGAAVRSGLDICKKLDADYVIKIDADGQHNPDDIPKLLKNLLNDSADIVYGNRILNFKTTFIRRAGNRFFSMLMRYMTNWDIKDSQPGIFAINKECLASIKIFGNYNYTQQVLLSSQLMGMRFVHEDVLFSKRQTGTSFVDLRYVYKALSQILVLLICFQPLRVFGRFGLFLLTIGLLTFTYQLIGWSLGYSERVIENVNLILGLSIVGGQSLLAGLLGQLIVNQSTQNQLSYNFSKKTKN